MQVFRNEDLRRRMKPEDEDVRVSAKQGMVEIMGMGKNYLDWKSRGASFTPGSASHQLGSGQVTSPPGHIFTHLQNGIVYFTGLWYQSHRLVTLKVPYKMQNTIYTSCSSKSLQQTFVIHKMNYQFNMFIQNYVQMNMLFNFSITFTPLELLSLYIYVWCLYCALWHPRHYIGQQRKGNMESKLRKQ